MNENKSDLEFLPGTENGNLRFGESLLGPETGLGVFNLTEIGEYEPICEYGGITIEENSENVFTQNEYSYLDPIRHRLVIGNQWSYGSLTQDSLDDSKNNCVVK